LTGIVADWRDGWTDWSRRIAPLLGSRHAPAVAAGVLGLAAVTEVLARGLGTGVGVGGVLTAVILALGTTVPLAYLGPAAAAVCVCLASVLSLTVVRTLTVAGLAAVLIVLYRFGRAGARWPLLAPVLGVPFLITALAGSLSPGSYEGALAVLTAALGPAAGLAGIARRARVQAEALSAARQVIADSLVEHTARGERARIARELHDVVAHHISMIAVQAETARLATPEMPAAGAQRLLEIGDRARAGLTEMRRLLGVLREDAQAADPLFEIGDRRPQPGLEQLNELLDEARQASGAGTRLIVSGPLAPLDPGVELAAYRIIQEGLTNARRHAPGAAVDVELHFTESALQLRIRDNGPGPPPAVPLDTDGGHGLTGMRERAAAAGGDLSVGAAPGGGFLIEAALPAKAEVTG
jgi:signal transduction histidine kinase